MAIPLEPYVTAVTPWGTFTTKNRITDLSGITQTSNDLSSSSSVTLTMSDTDGVLKIAYDGSVMYNAEISVWQHFVGGAGYLLFVGVAGGDIVWDEGSRTLTLDVESIVTTSKVGHVPKTKTSVAGVWSPQSWPASWNLDIELEALDQQAFGKMWPLGFGDVIHCPALRLTKPIIGKLKDPIDNDSTSIIIDGGDQFPQGVSTTIRIGKVFYTGTFTGDTFAVTTANVTWVLTAPFYESKFDFRPPLNVDVNAVNAAWVADMFDYSNAWIQITGDGIGGTALVHVSEQLGRKLIFDFAPPVLLNQTHVITGFTGALKTGQADLVVVEDDGYSLKYIADNWDILKGAHVTDLNVQWYVVNELPSTIHTVRAYRVLNGIRTLDVVPEAYYTVFPTQPLDGITATLIGMPMSLESIPDEGWEKDIYVSYTSSEGPNAADVMDYILTTYSNLTPDGSFASTASAIDDYPVGFALFDQRDALQLVSDIAFQARCSLSRLGTVATLRYLSTPPSGYDTLDNTNILEDTMKLSFTRLEDIRTHLIASWNTNYSDTGSRTLEYLNNEDVYGVIEEKLELFIYNQAALAKKSLDFWGYRKSNVWRTVQFEVPLVEYNYHVGDEYSFDLPYWGVTRGTLKSVTTNTYTRSLFAVMASLMGDSDTTNLNYYKGDPTNEIIASDPDLAKDLTVGLYQIDYHPAVTKREKQKIYTISTTNESGREVKQYDIMIQNKDSTLVTTDEDGGESVGLIDVDNLHRTASEMYIVQAVTANSDPLDCWSANKHISRVRWNPSDPTPVINEIWGPMPWVVADPDKQTPDYEAGTISDEGNAFIVVGGIDTATKTCLVAPNIGEIYSEVVFRQENSKLPADGEYWPKHMNPGVGKRIVGIVVSAEVGSTTQYVFGVSVGDAVPDPQLSNLDLSTNKRLTGLGVFLPRGEYVGSTGRLGIKTVGTPDVGVKGVVIRIQLVNCGRNTRDLDQSYQVAIP